MKNLVKTIGIIALVAVIGTTMVTCGGDGGDSDSRVVESKYRGTFSYDPTGNEDLIRTIEITEKNATYRAIDSWGSPIENKYRVFTQENELWIIQSDSPDNIHIYGTFTDTNTFVAGLGGSYTYIRITQE